MRDDVRRMSEELARDPQSLAFLPLGEWLRRQGQLQHAQKIALRGLERYPHLADGHDLLARIYADLGDPERAFDEWDMARRIAPGHAGAAKGIGFIHFGRGELAEAERVLSEAAEASPADEGLRSALAYVRSATVTADGRSAVVPSSDASDAPVADRPQVTEGGMASDSRDLFASVLVDSTRTALLLDRDGLVLAGAYYTGDGRDVAEEIGAHLSGVSDEAMRTTRHLGVGPWRAIVFEAEAATVAMAPSADEGLLVLAAGGATPLGLTRRLLDRCAERARAWLGDAR